jgi:hypothetical protein
MNAVLPDIRHEKEMKHLPYDDLIASALASEKKLHDKRQSFADLTLPLEYAQQRNLLTDLITPFQLDFEQLSAYKDQFAVCVANVKKRRDDEKLARKNARTKFLERLRQLELPLCLCNLMATALANTTEETWQEGLSPEGAEELTLVTAEDPAVLADALGRVLIFQKYDEPTHYHTEILALFDSIQKQAANKGDNMVRQIKKIGGTHGCSVMDGHEVVWCTPDAPDRYHALLGKVLVHALMPNRVNFSLTAFPWVSMSCLVTCITGRLYICVLQPDQVQGAGADIGAYLSTLPSGSLSRNHQFILAPQQSIFIPLGYAPIIFALAGDKDESMQILSDQRRKTSTVDSGNCLYAVSLALDKHHAQHEATTKRLVSSSMLRGNDWMPSIVREWASYQSYFDMLLAGCKGPVSTAIDETTSTSQAIDESPGPSAKAIDESPSPASKAIDESLAVSSPATCACAAENGE